MVLFNTSLQNSPKFNGWPLQAGLLSLEPNPSQHWLREWQFVGIRDRVQCLRESQVSGWSKRIRCVSSNLPASPLQSIRIGANSLSVTRTSDHFTLILRSFEHLPFWLAVPISLASHTKVCVNHPQAAIQSSLPTVCLCCLVILDSLLLKEAILATPQGLWWGSSISLSRSCPFLCMAFSNSLIQVWLT